MMNTPASWRKSPFETGRQYRVRCNFKALRESFQEGEVLTYNKDTYSIYDSCTGYLFSDESGRIRVWDVSDDDDLELWSDYFVLVSP